MNKQELQRQIHLNKRKIKANVNQITLVLFPSEQWNEAEKLAMEISNLAADNYDYELQLREFE